MPTKEEKEVELTCCGGLEELQKLRLPFDKPLTWDQVNNTLTCDLWAVTVLKLTPSGAFSRGKKAEEVIYFNYMFCGADIRAKKEELGA